MADNLTRKSAVVVGATGFVGSHIVRNLLEKGYHVQGTCRNALAAKWLFDCTPNQDNLKLHEVTFDVEKTSEHTLAKLISDDCRGIFMCAGYEKQEPSTIDFMSNAAMTALKASEISNAKPCVVLTSSTGSTNLPGAPADALKNEIEFWSDPESQKSKKKWSPAAKTLMEINSLEYVGRNQKDEVVDEKMAENKPRLCIMNPSLILGPQIRPGKILGNGLPFFAKVVRGQAMAEKIWDDSMSIIHVDDLAKLHIGCIENQAASGRYFGVEQSWHWEDICLAIQAAEGNSFKMPPKEYTERAAVTQFNTARRDTLMTDFKLCGLATLVSQSCAFLRGKEI